MANLTFLNATSNQLSESLLHSLPASIEVLYLSNNSITGTIPDNHLLPPGLTILDLSNNSLSGTLPPNLPANLAILNASNNHLSGTLPRGWSRLAELWLDNNVMLTGKLPAEWHTWGSNTSNSIQLSLVNNRLHGSIPQQWVQQFCLATLKNFSEQTLYTPTPYQFQLFLGESRGQELDPITVVPTGSQIVTVAQHASIVVTLNGKTNSFTYSDPDSICSIPNAVRNVVLLWGAFAALLLVTVIGVKISLRNQAKLSSSAVTAKLAAAFNHKKLHLPKRVVEAIYYFLLDIVYFIYSQVTDAITIHQVYTSGQLKYFYLLLAILLFHFVLVYLLVVRVSVKKYGLSASAQCQAHSGKGCLHQALAGCKGLVLSPILFFALDIGLIFEGIGVPLPEAVKSFKVNIFSLYRAQSIAESLFNALPQAVVQSKLYLEGNSPNGIRVYIDTKLFLVSVIGSLLSLLKTIAVIMIEAQHSQCGVVAYFRKLVNFEPIEGYKDLQQVVRTTSQDVPLTGP